jgi:prepilin-type N-terminal cleavage/methylation domain-containing protein
MKQARGYTIVELMMSIALLAIGIAGVLGMQKVTIATNRSAKEIAVATRIGEAWIDALATDASTWTTDTNGNSTRDKTVWLSTAVKDDITDWFIPSYSAALNMGPAFSVLGSPQDPTVKPEIDHYCVHIRFAYLHSETLPTKGNGVIRAQVRVFWPREDAAWDGTTNLVPNITALCSNNNADFTNNISGFHVLYLSTALRQVPPQGQGLL